MILLSHFVFSVIISNKFVFSGDTMQLEIKMVCKRGHAHLKDLRNMLSCDFNVEKLVVNHGNELSLHFFKNCIQVKDAIICKKGYESKFV